MFNNWYKQDRGNRIITNAVSVIELQFTVIHVCVYRGVIGCSNCTRRLSLRRVISELVPAVSCVYVYSVICISDKGGGECAHDGGDSE